MKHKAIGLILALLATSAIAAPDLSLWYCQPASKWLEALPIGNGCLGGMITVTNGELAVVGADAVTLLLAAATDYDANPRRHFRGEPPGFQGRGGS